VANAGGGNSSGDWRDPAVFGPLEKRIGQAEEQEQPPIHRAHPKGRSPRRSPYARATAGGKSSARVKPAAREESKAFAAAKEMTTRAAHDIRRQFGAFLTRDESVRLVSMFRAGVVPRRKAGRRPNAQVTAAYLDWKAGIRGLDLYRKHIPGWQKHGEWRRKGEKRALMDAIRSRRRRERD
jgi:hypothetical protein